jgi:hypothetical protein
MQSRCVRKRKHSKRAIYCPIHNCFLDSVSQKYPLYAHFPEHLQQSGVGKRSAQMLISAQGSLTLDREWLEKFWCSSCQESNWYRVSKRDTTYQCNVAPREMWQRAVGVSDPQGNPSVGQFTRCQARGTNG